MVDVEETQLAVARLLELVQKLFADLVTGLGEDLAGLLVDEFVSEIHAVKFGVLDQQVLDAVLGDLAGEARRDLLAGLDDHLAGLGIDQVDGGLDALEALRVERRLPAGLRQLVGDRLVEGVQDLLAVEAQGIEQRGDRQLAAAVDARIDDVLGVELEVEPGTAIGNDARGEQQLAGRMRLALVVIEEHAGRTMHLGNDDALGAVDDEGAVGRHERHVAHVDVLLLDVLHRLGLGVRIDFEHDQAQRDLERSREGHAALLALVDVELRLFEFVAHEFEHGLAGEVGDRKHRLEHGLQALVRAPALGLHHLQELIVAFALNLDEVRHFGHFDLPAKELAEAFAASGGLSFGHGVPLTVQKHAYSTACRTPLSGRSGKPSRTAR